jgi:hypothetical protein
MPSITAATTVLTANLLIVLIGLPFFSDIGQQKQEVRLATGNHGGLYPAVRLRAGAHTGINFRALPLGAPFRVCFAAAYARGALRRGAAGER